MHKLIILPYIVLNFVYYIILYCTVPDYTILYFVTIYYVTLYSVMLYYTMFCNVSTYFYYVLHFVIYYTILYCIYIVSAGEPQHLHSSRDPLGKIPRREEVADKSALSSTEAPKELRNAVLIM